jgi:hypothetical protein
MRYMRYVLRYTINLFFTSFSQVANTYSRLFSNNFLVNNIAILAMIQHEPSTIDFGYPAALILLAARVWVGSFERLKSVDALFERYTCGVGQSWQT